MYGLDDIGEYLGWHVKFNISNGVVDGTAIDDDGVGLTPGRVYLEAGKTYIFNCETDAERWGHNTDVNAYLLYNGGYQTIYDLDNGNYEFIPWKTGIYHLRLDVYGTDNNHKFWNISVTEKDPETKTVVLGEEYGELPTPTKTGYTFKGWNGKNLFDESKFLLISNYIINGNGNSKWAKIQLKPNTNYKMSVVRYNGYNGIESSGWLIIHSKPDPNVMGWSSIMHESYPNINYNYITGNDGLLYIGYSRESTQTILNNIWTNTDVQLEEGTTATEYEPYYITNTTKVVQDKNHTLKAIWEKDNN